MLHQLPAFLKRAGAPHLQGGHDGAAHGLNGQGDVRFPGSHDDDGFHSVHKVHHLFRVRETCGVRAVGAGQGAQGALDAVLVHITDS